MWIFIAYVALLCLLLLIFLIVVKTVVVWIAVVLLQCLVPAAVPARLRTSFLLSPFFIFFLVTVDIKPK